MATPRTPKTKADDDDLTRIDPFRSDEDTGGAAAPPLRPRDSDTGQDTVHKPAKPPS
jgi:hypothetical protein